MQTLFAGETRSANRRKCRNTFEYADFWALYGFLVCRVASCGVVCVICSDSIPYFEEIGKTEKTGVSVVKTERGMAI